MTRDVMGPFRVGRTGNAELDDALARLENMRQSLDYTRGTLEDGGRDDLDRKCIEIDRALFALTRDILK